MHVTPHLAPFWKWGLLLVTPAQTRLHACKVPEILLPRPSISGITDKHYYAWLYLHSGDLSQALTLVWKALPTAPDRTLFLCMERKQCGGGSRAQSQQICRVQRPFWGWQGEGRLETGTISPQDSTFWNLLRWVRVCVGAGKETRPLCGGSGSKKQPAPEPSCHVHTCRPSADRDSKWLKMAARPTLHVAFPVLSCVLLTCAPCQLSASFPSSSCWIPCPPFSLT